MDDRPRRLDFVLQPSKLTTRELDQRPSPGHILFAAPGNHREPVRRRIDLARSGGALSN
jgi:hypothetical protein